MIRRIVRLTIEENKIDEFITNFNNNKVAIRNFEGCEHLELWRDDDAPNVFVTYSHWESLDHLNAYRHSPMFQTIWAKTKTYFSGKPMAWSHQWIA